MFFSKHSPTETSIEFLRRLGPDPHKNGAQTIALQNCPDIFELENGCFAIIGIDITERAISKLPPSAGCGADDRIVLIPRNLLVNAKCDIPDSVWDVCISSSMPVSLSAMGGTWNWSELLQDIGIIGGLLFSASSLLLATYTTWRNERARQAANSIAVKGQHWDIWKEIFTHPQLKRVRDKEVDLERQPLSEEEEIFVTSLILHLDTSFRAAKRREFVTLDGLPFDVQEFFSLPIPNAVWQKLRSFQNHDFSAFVEKCVHNNPYI